MYIYIGSIEGNKISTIAIFDRKMYLPYKTPFVLFRVLLGKDRYFCGVMFSNDYCSPSYNYGGWLVIASTETRNRDYDC